MTHGLTREVNEDPVRGPLGGKPKSKERKEGLGLKVGLLSLPRSPVPYPTPVSDPRTLDSVGGKVGPVRSLRPGRRDTVPVLGGVEGTPTTTESGSESTSSFYHPDSPPPSSDDGNQD